MSTEYRFITQTSEGEVRGAAQEAGFVIEQHSKDGQTWETVTDGKNHIHVHFNEGMCTGFTRFGGNDKELIYTLAELLDAVVISEHDEGFFD
jgi:hypothetical protein